MGKPPNLIEVPDRPPEIDREKELEEHGARPGATKAVYIVIVVVTILLFVLVTFALHKPAGE